LDFFTKSQAKITAMQHKRYNNDRYREARKCLIDLRSEPTLEDIVSYLMACMLRESMIP
jgi:hypothetical protein